MSSCLVQLCIVVAFGGAVDELRPVELPPLEGRQNLAAGRPVVFAPAPDYGLTATGDTDATDLTDGHLTTRADRSIWFDRRAVGWSYGGRVNLAVDLGQTARIDEIAIRLLGGSAQPGISLPVWVEVLVSSDGERYEKVGEFSRWRPDDVRRFGVPDDAGKSWIHCLRFTDLAAHGRWVGYRMYTAGLSASDELYVFGAPATTAPASDSGASDARASASPRASDFSVSRPQPYFHKPVLVLATNVCGPVPLGIVTPTEDKQRAPVELVLDLPAGVELLAAQLGKPTTTDLRAEAAPDGTARYRLAVPTGASTKTAGRLYLRATGWKDGQRGQLRYHVIDAQHEGPSVEVPLEAVTIPAAPRLRQMMVSLGWWSASDTARWPDALNIWQHVGLNTFPLFPMWMKEDDPDWRLVEEARERGFFIATIDSTFHRMLQRHQSDPELYHQLADGKTSTQFCPAYRGPHYREEIERFARETALARPKFASLDIELWGWRGPTEGSACRRCQEDFRASGLADWDQWMAAKGTQMWRELVTAARAACQQAGAEPFEIGGYDFRPGSAYQKLWSVDQLYPDWMQSSQVSTYTSLNPYHLGLIGDEVRADRGALERSDVLPWLTPGDAGTFAADSFQWALLECYLNGARGVWFWSSRVWDVENLVAYNRVVRALAPVEDALIQGQLVGDAAQIEGEGRVSGIRHAEDILLLAADYFGRASGRLKVRLQVPARSQVQDLLGGQVIGEVAAGEQVLEIPLQGARARLLHVRPVR